MEPQTFWHLRESSYNRAQWLLWCVRTHTTHMGGYEYSVPAHDTVTGRDMLKQSDIVAYVCIYTHVIRAAVTGMQRGKTTAQAEQRWEQHSSGWKRGVCRFLWWMWQPLWYLMSLRHGWRIVGEWSFLCCWHRTAAQWIWCLLTVCHTAVTMILGWWERGWKKKGLERVETGSCIRLHYVYPVCEVFEVSCKYRAYADQSWLFKRYLKHFSFDFMRYIDTDFSVLVLKTKMTLHTATQCKYYPLV